MNKNQCTDPTSSKPTPENPVAETVGISESTNVCPSCDYTGDTEFATCPRCGIIIQKYNSRLQHATLSTSVGDVAQGSMGKGILACGCLLLIVVGLVLFLLNRPAPKQESAIPSPLATAPSGPSTNPSTDTGVPNSYADTIPNNLGITVQRVIFASDIDAQNMPVDDLTRVPFTGKKVVVRVKMVMPPEKAYQFTGKFYDGEGKLVMNVTSPSTPTLSVWYAWYYHNLSRADDKPGTWKFVFLVNDEPVLEKFIEVTD